MHFLSCVAWLSKIIHINSFVTHSKFFFFFFSISFFLLLFFSFIFHYYIRIILCIRNFVKTCEYSIDEVLFQGLYKLTHSLVD
jgi:hypothetical protein